MLQLGCASAGEAVAVREAACDHDGSGCAGRGGSGDPSDVGGSTVAPVEAMYVGRRPEGVENVIEQALVGCEELASECGEGAEELAVLGELGLASQAAGDVALGLGREAGRYRLRSRPTGC